MRSPIATSRLFVFLMTAMLAFALPAAADTVTVSGNVSFSSLDGSSLDDDGVANGTFTNSDGDLIVLGSVNCNDSGAGGNSACAMRFVISGNVVLDPGSALYAENRTGGGNGGDITLTVGGNLVVAGTGAQPGAIISSASNDGSGNGGAITASVGGTSTFGAGSAVSSASIGGNAGAIAITSAGLATIDGLIAAGPSRTLIAANRFSGEPLNGGSSNQKGGNITINGTSTSEPGLIVNGNATIVSQGQTPGAGLVRLDGCATQIRGVVASVGKDGVSAGVTVRSGTSLTIDGRDLAIAGGTRKGQLRADSSRGTAAPYSVRALGRTTVSVLGATTGGIAVLNANPGANNAAGGTIDVISTEGDVVASGNAMRAGDTANGDSGGTINVSAKGNVNLDTAALRANGGSNGNQGQGGDVNVRSHSGSVSWQNGTGDVRPTGSSIQAANRGTITLTYCTTVNTTGSTFPVNGSPTGPWPTLVQTCSPAAPSLPLGETLPVCNRPPVVTNDAYTVAEGGTLNVPAPGVLGNDVEPDGQPMTAILVSGPSNASSFTFNADGSFNYVHNGGETTSDSFTYKASDGTLESSVATVSITITPVNDPPVANNDAYSVAEGGTLNLAAPGVKSNDTDPDNTNASLIVSLVSGPSNASAFTLNADGSFVYTHNGTETTSDSFTYQLSDGLASSNVATVTITIDAVNDAPVANNDSYTVAEGGTLNVVAPGVLGNDTDAEGSTLTAILISGPANASSFTLNANGSFNYVHNGGETTTDSFTYRANDGSSNSNIATVNITITPVNDAPVAVDDAYTVAEGGTLVIPPPGVLGNDTDSDSPMLTATVGTSAGNGMLTLNPDGSFTYVHNGGESTSDSFTYTASDGSLSSNVATVTITITPVNDAPVAVDDAYSVNEGGTLNVAAPGVLGNDTDVDTLPAGLSAVLVSGPANASSFTLNADGSFTYVHNGGETTSDSFTYRANDGSLNSNIATVTITIAPVNDAPVAVADAYSVNEGGTLTVPAPGVLGNDTDVDTPPAGLSAILVSGPANASSFTLNANGSFTYVHNGSETTSDSFTYKANDGSLDSNVVTVTITIVPVNDPPVAVNDAYSVNEGDTLTVPAPGVLGNDTDAEMDSLTAVLVSGPANATSFTLNADGSFTYVHNGSETTTDSFTYRANDGTVNGNIATVTITINPVNDAPVANPDSYNGFANTPLNVPAPGVLGNDTDVDTPPAGLSAILVTGPTNAASFTLNANGSFSYTPNSGFTGTDTFTYKANDGSLDSNVTTVTITIVAQPPVANDDSYTTVGNTELRVGAAGTPTPRVFVAGSVLANDTDPDTPVLTVSAFSATSTAGGTVVMAPNGTFNYFPPVGFIGTDTFTYTATDGTSTDNATVTITVFSRVWYVNNTAASGTGRSHQPFPTLSAAQSASAAGDYIYVHFGNGTTTGQNAGIVLKNNQKLVGEGVALVVGAFTLHPAGGTPTIGNSSGAGVTLANGNTVTGLNVAAFGIGISGSSVNSGTIEQVAISGGSDGISLSSASGTFLLTNVNITPGGVGLFINGGTPAVSASNLDIVTSNAKGIVGTGSGSLATSSGSTVASTNAVAVDINGLSLSVSLQSVNASGSTNGILLQNTTGSFAVTGTGTAGTGGTISNTTQRGVSAINASNVSLSFMSITNGAAANGTAANVCGDTLNGTTTGCNASIHLENVSGASFTNVVVNGSAQIGINGHTVSNLSMTNVEVANAGNEVFEHGVQFVNLSGTSSISGSNFHDNFYRQFTVQNSAGSLTLNVTGTTFDGRGLATATNAQGALVSTSGTASITANVQTSTFTDNFSTGWHTDTAGSSTANVTINGSTFTNNGGAINLAAHSSGSLSYAITNNVSNGSPANAINVFRGSLGTGQVVGTIDGNTLGTLGVPGSGCSGPCDAIALTSNGSGNFQSRVSNNIIRNFTTRAISFFAGEGSSNAQAKINNNTISQPLNTSSVAILANSGTLTTDTTSMCADIVSNAISGTYGAAGAIRVRNRFPGTQFRLPGYAGAGNDTTAVAAFVSGQNGGVTVTATINGNIFGGGAACTTP